MLSIEVMGSNHNQIYLCPMFPGGCGEPRGIVVENGNQTLCNASTCISVVFIFPSKEMVLALSLVVVAANDNDKTELLNPIQTKPKFNSWDLSNNMVLRVES